MMTIAAQSEPADFSYHLQTLGLDAEPERNGLSKHLDDTFPAVANLLRRVGASVIVTASFPRFHGRVWYVALISAPKCAPFAISVTEDRIRMDGDVTLKAGDVDSDGITFWRVLSEKIANALVQGGR